MATGESQTAFTKNVMYNLSEDQVEQMFKEAEQFADRDKVMQRVAAKNAFGSYIHSKRSATESSKYNKGLSEKMGEEEKEKIMDALQDGESWLDSNPEADAGRIQEKHKEIEDICFLIAASEVL